MKAFITGVDADGRSCVAEVVDVEPGPVPGGMAGMAYARIFGTEQSPPPPRPPGSAPHMDNGLEPGFVRNLVIDRRPEDETVVVHNTDTLDFVLVQTGSVTLILDDGEHEVVAGDLVVMTGVDHGWRTGPDGCRQVLIAIGTPPPD